MAIGLLGVLASPYCKVLLLEFGTWAAPRVLDQVKKRRGSPWRYHGGSMTINSHDVKRALNGAWRAGRPQVRGVLVQVEEAAHQRVRHLEKELSVQPEPRVRARLWPCMLGYCVVGSASAFLSSALEDGTDEPHAYATV